MRKKWIAYLVFTFFVLMLSFNTFADEVNEFTFRNCIKFGMSKAEVLQAEIEINQTNKSDWYPLTPEKWEWLFYDDFVEVSDYAGIVMYSFADGFLQGANYMFGIYGEGEYKDLSEALSEVYGEKTSIPNDKLNEMARPVIAGVLGSDVKLSDGYVWYQDNVTIYEYQYGDDGQFAITYLNPNFDYEAFNNGTASTGGL